MVSVNYVNGSGNGEIGEVKSTRMDQPSDLAAGLQRPTEKQRVARRR